MTITNGYCSLEEIRERLTIGKRRTATTIAFVDGGAGADTITDTALGLEMFPTGARIRVQGSTSNDGYYTIVSGGVAGVITLATGTLTAEAAGDSVTITDVTDVQDDAKLESMVEAISRAIDAELETRFYTTASDETRYYVAEFADVLFCPDDIVAVTALYTDDDGDGTYENTWAATDYDLEPYNASADGRPYRQVRTTPEGDHAFPVGARKGVKVVGRPGSF